MTSALSNVSHALTGPTIPAAIELAMSSCDISRNLVRLASRLVATDTVLGFIRLPSQPLKMEDAIALRVLHVLAPGQLSYARARLLVSDIS